MAVLFSSSDVSCKRWCEISCGNEFRDEEVERAELLEDFRTVGVENPAPVGRQAFQLSGRDRGAAGDERPTLSSRLTRERASYRDEPSFAWPVGGGVKNLIKVSFGRRLALGG